TDLRAVAGSDLATVFERRTDTGHRLDGAASADTLVRLDLHAVRIGHRYELRGEPALVLRARRFGMRFQAEFVQLLAAESPTFGDHFGAVALTGQIRSVPGAVALAHR